MSNRQSPPPPPEIKYGALEIWCASRPNCPVPHIGDKPLVPAGCTVGERLKARKHLQVAAHPSTFRLVVLPESKQQARDSLPKGSHMLKTLSLATLRSMIQRAQINNLEHALSRLIRNNIPYPNMERLVPQSNTLSSLSALPHYRKCRHLILILLSSPPGSCSSKSALETASGLWHMSD